jgi:hypothetical protein
MISLAEFEIAVLGLLRLARFDAGFAGFFDLSRDGARRSFRLALWLLPIYLFLSHLNANWPEDTDMTRVVAAELIGYALMWICFPLLLVLFARVIERENRIYGAIALYNWLAVLSVGLQTPIWIACYFGLDINWGAGLTDIVVLFCSACLFFAFRRLLEIRIEMVIALVIVEYILSRILEVTTYGLAHGSLF